MKTDCELKRLAVDIVGGLVFTDRHLSDIQLADGHIKKVFLPLMLNNMYTPEHIQRGEVAMIYEYLDKSGKTHNDNSGLPAFATINILSQAEVSKLSDYIQQYEHMMEGHIEFDANFVS